MRRSIAALLAFSLSACAIDKTPTQPPKPTSDPAPQTKPEPPPKPQAPAESRTTPPAPTAVPSAKSSTANLSEDMSEFVPLSIFEKLRIDVFMNSGPAQGTGPAPALKTPEQRMLWALAQAAKNDGDQDFFRMLADDYNQLFAVENQTGRGLFHALAQYDMVDVVHALITAGLTKNITLRDVTRRYPIHYAKSEAMVKELWSFNSHTAADLNGQTPLLRLAQTDSSAAVRFVAGQLCVSGSLFPAFYTKHINDADKDGKTALHFAAILANVREIDALLNCADIKIDVKDVQKRTPLHYVVAALNDSSAAAYAILAKARALADDDYSLKAYLNQQDVNGDTPLHLANRCLNTGVANLLIYYGAGTDLKNAKGETALAQTTHDCLN